MLQEGNQTTFTGGVEVMVDLVDADGRRQRSFNTGETMTLRISATFEAEVRAPLLGVMVAPLGLGTPAYMTHTVPNAYRRRHDPDHPLEAEVTLAVKLLAGGYTVTVGVYDGTGSMMLGTTPAESFYVSSAHVHAGGLVDLEATVVIDGKELPKPRRSRLSGGNGLPGRLRATARLTRLASAGRPAPPYRRSRGRSGCWCP